MTPTKPKRIAPQRHGPTLSPSRTRRQRRDEDRGGEIEGHHVRQRQVDHRDVEAEHLRRGEHDPDEMQPRPPHPHRRREPAPAHQRQQDRQRGHAADEQHLPRRERADEPFPQHVVRREEEDAGKNQDDGETGIARRRLRAFDRGLRRKLSGLGHFGFSISAEDAPPIAESARHDSPAACLRSGYPPGSPSRLRRMMSRQTLPSGHIAASLVGA